MDVVAEPHLLQLLRPHRGEITCLDAASAWMVTGGADRALRLWRWTSAAAGCTGWCEHAVAVAAHRHGVTVVRWAGAGLLLASGGIDGAARVWGRELSPRRRLLAPGATAVRALCWMGGSARLLVGYDDGALCVWSAAAGKLVARLRPHEDSLRAVATPAREALLLTACADGVLKVFDLAEVCACGAEGEGAGPTPLLWVDGAHDLGALCADASEAGVAATAGQDGRVRLWRTEEQQGERRRRTLQEWGAPLEGHAAAVTAVRWATAADGMEVLASASLDRTARLWLAGGGCLCVLHGHLRYLTCVALAPDLRFMITGSNDRTVRTWSLGAFSLEDDLKPDCEVLTHFGLGDLEGIGPVDDTVAEVMEKQAEPGALTLSWSWQQAHRGAVNCVAGYGDLLATASSDGLVKIYRWDESREQPLLQHELEAHQYPVLAAEFGSEGRVLLTAGLDGCAFLWDVQSGVQLRALSVPTAERRGEAGGGGGGVRAARVSPHRPPLLLLATDDGIAPLWSLASAEPEPFHVYTEHLEAVTCCAWSPDGRLLATGATSGELRLHTPPPLARTLHHEPLAHDLGVQSCEFASHPDAVGVASGEHVLATGGCDSLVKLWSASEGGARLLRQVPAHGGGVTCVRWGAGSLLASAGADGWARVWRVAAGGATVRCLAEAAAPGALAAALLTPVALEQSVLLAVGTVGGGLAVWRLSEGREAAGDRDNEADTAEEHSPVRLWCGEGVARWLHEYVTPDPADEVRSAWVMKLMERARQLRLRGNQLLDEPLPVLLDLLEDGSEDKAEEEVAERRARLQTELEWLRRPEPSRAIERGAPHALLCPLTHRLLREPVAATDGFTYERAAILEWFLADESGSSPVSGRRLASRRVRPNIGLRDRVRDYLRQYYSPQSHSHEPPLDPRSEQLIRSD